MTRILGAVAIMALVTLFTRAAPFLFFARRKPPELLDYLQRYLPPVVMTVLVINALKDQRFLDAPFGLPALAGAATAAFLHVWRRNALVSIVGATGLYMVLIRVFPA